MTTGKKNNVFEGPSVDYVNEVVLKGMNQWGIAMTPDCIVTNRRGLRALDLILILRNHGWSWPTQWYRKNLNYFQHYFGAEHLEKEVERGRWIHIVVSPALSRKQYFSWHGMRLSRTINDWSLPPREIELHAENGWLKPSSFQHLWKFLRDKLWPF